VTLIGRTVDVVYDLTDTSVITVEDAQLGVSIAAKPLVIGEHSGPRPKLPEQMLEQTPETSRLLDAKAESFKSRRTSVQRALNFSGSEGDDNV
jgi:hypothetical protein